MSENAFCSFCEQLSSITQPTRGRASKCPICKQELWECDGRTHRLVEGAPASRRAMWIAGAGMSVALSIGIVAIALFLTNRDRQPRDSAPSVESPAPQLAAAARPPKVVRAPERPMISAKPGAPDDGVCVKPPPVVVDTRAVVKPGELAYGQQVATVKPAFKVLPRHLSYSMVHSPESHLEDLLREVPQVDLEPEYAKKTKAQLADAAKKIVADAKGDKDAFVTGLKKTRPDLAGMPFLMGDDCQLDKNDARSLATMSLMVRDLMAKSIKETKYVQRSPTSEMFAPDPAAEYFWSRLNSSGSRSSPRIDCVPALKQIISAENSHHRLLMANHLHGVMDKKATEALAQLAVFDLSPEVRQLAVHGLKSRPQFEYQAILTKALRYPWSPVAQHAAQAIVELRLEDMVPDLVAMLNEPDPQAPFVVKAEGAKPKTMVRELVRVNHHRNCMLCHAPVSVENGAQTGLRELPVGPVTSAQEPLPPSASPVYYSLQKGVTVVRADITYLRQDFSVRQKVDDHGKWPEMQRFDFFVRTVELTEKEAAARKPAAGASAFHATVLSTLQALTGQSYGPNSADWQDEVLLRRRNAEAKRNGMR